MLKFSLQYKVEERLKEIANPCGLPLPSIFQQDFDIDEGTCN